MPLSHMVYGSPETPVRSGADEELYSLQFQHEFIRIVDLNFRIVLF